MARPKEGDKANHAECLRCGGCCHSVALDWGPRELHEEYLKWKRGENYKVKNIAFFYTALEFMEYDSVNRKYRYQCRHLNYTSEGVAECWERDTRPDMCRDFPYGHTKGNGKLYPGCRFGILEALK